MPDELDPPVRAGSAGASRISVSKTNAQYTAVVIAQRVVERRVVVTAQVAAKPDERASARPAGRAEFAATWGDRNALAPSVQFPIVTSVDLTHHFLIAMPSMADPYFSRTLTFICEHNDQGALGLVVNRPIDMTLAALFERIDLKLDDRRAAQACRSTSAARCRPIAASCCTRRSGDGSRRSSVRDRTRPHHVAGHPRGGRPRRRARRSSW